MNEDVVRSRSASNASSISSSVSTSTTTGKEPLSDDAVMNAIEAFFFEQQSEASVTRRTLEALESGARDDVELVKEYERAVEVVNARLAERVMSNYNLFVAGMAKIHELGVDLQQSAVMCKNGRRLLAGSQAALTTQGLVVAAKTRKQQLLGGVATDLRAVAEIRAGEQELREALDAGDYPRAIALCIACRDALQAYEQLTCLASFSAYVHSSWALLLRRVETAVRDVVRRFDALAYERVLLAHQRMGRGFHALERLQRQFIDTINEHAKNALYAHVLQSERNAMRAEELKGKKFNELADALDDAHFVDCLHTILEYLCDLLHSHHQMTRWHAERDAARDADADETAFFDSVLDSLTRFRKTMWNKMQRKVSAILSTSQLASYKIDEFLRVLDSVYRFIAIGEAFSGCDSDHLRRSIKQQSKAYFENLHKSRMEDLSIMLANEQWQPCPVADDFALERIKEFRAVASSAAVAAATNAAAAAQPPSAKSAAEREATAQRLFAEHAANGNPFGKEALTRANEAARAARKAEDAAHVERSAASPRKTTQRGGDDDNDNGDDDDDAPADTSLFVTTTTINVARYIGKYIRMMQILEPIAYQIFLGIAQLFDFYLCTVHQFFVASVAVPPSLASLRELRDATALPSELRDTVQRMREKLEASARVGVDLTPHVDSNVAERLADANELHGAARVAVACESLCALARAAQHLQPQLVQLLASRASAQRRVSEFYTRSVGGAAVLRRHAYNMLSSQLLPFEDMYKLVEATNWSSTKEVGTECNVYVTRFREEYRLFAVRAHTLEADGAIPHSVYLLLWRAAVARGMDVLIEGFASAKKCSDQGVMLRKLDVQELCAELNTLVPKEIERPLPRQQDVGDYVRAYYTDGDHFLPFVKQNQEKFTETQMVAIINQGMAKSMKKQLRKDLTMVVEEIFKQANPSTPLKTQKK